MITIKTKEEIETLKEGGKRLAYILNEVAKAVAPGVSTSYLNDLAHKLTIDGGDKPAFLNYTPEGARRAYPASLCVSVNDEIVHGIPNENSKILKEGDVVSLDMGLIHKNLITDSAITVGVGKIDNKSKRLIEATKGALYAGINAAKGGKKVKNITEAIEEFVKPTRFSIAEDLGGHGVGYKVHEEPFVANYTIKGGNELLKPGMVIAIEPMLNEGVSGIKIDKDGYTVKTKDGKRSAHFEHTIAITNGDPEILT